jgi:hypothetical protein
MSKQTMEYFSEKSEHFQQRQQQLGFSTTLPGAPTNCSRGKEYADLIG